MNTDSSVVIGQGWVEVGKGGGKMGNICNCVNSIKKENIF